MSILLKNQNAIAPLDSFNAAPLSYREKEILCYLVKGLSHKQIAASCNITYDTVRFHMKNIYHKLQVSSMTEAVAKAITQQLV
jgi:DNA-binding NarL/FixJ family response regulator